MSTKTATKTKILLTLTVQQKKTIDRLAHAKGLSLSAYLRMKALEDSELETTDSSNSILKIQKYLSKKVEIPKKYKEYKDFKTFHKKHYKP